MAARMSMLPRIVADRELEPGNAVLNVTMQASIILGPALGGVIVGAFGTGWAFAADAACFAIGFLFIMWLPSAVRASGGEKPADGGRGGEIVGGSRSA